MKLYFLPLLKTAPAVIRVLSCIRKQKDFLLIHVQPLINQALKTNDGTLSQKDIIKINQYYGLAVPAILGEAICRLHGSKLSAAERNCLTSQGAMTGLFDDFFDEGKLNDSEIENKIFDPCTHPETTSNDKLFSRFYNNALGSCKSPEVLKDWLFKVYTFQVESKKQALPETSMEEIQKITLDKGGASLLFYRCGLSADIDNEEKELLFGLGGLMQLSNDIFDIYKDLQSGIRTLITETKNIEEVEHYFRTRLMELFSMSTSFNRRNLTRFFEMISLAIFSRVLVSLQQLKKCQASTGDIFSPTRYSREQLVCDMERRENLLLSAAFHCEIMKAVY